MLIKKKVVKKVAKPRVPSGKVTDPDIRVLLVDKLRKQFYQSRVVNEMCVCRCRVDVAVLSPQSGFVGYEIKSEADSLTRLRRQVTNYDHVFSYMTIVVYDNHYNHALEIIPSYWGVIKVTKNGFGKLALVDARSPTRNPRRKQYQVADMLWKQEIIDTLITLGVPKRGLGQRKVRQLVDMLTQAVQSTDHLEQLVITKMAARENWH